MLEILFLFSFICNLIYFKKLQTCRRYIKQLQIDKYNIKKVLFDVYYWWNNRSDGFKQRANIKLFTKVKKFLTTGEY